MPIPTIQTPRLLLRPFTMDDVGDSYRLNLDPEVTRFTGDGGVVSHNEIERRIREDVIGDYDKFGYGRMAVILKKENCFIGFAGLKYLPDLNETDLGYRLERNCWGQGLATEAGKACLEYGFEKLGLETITSMVLPENLASIRVLDKLGFKPDGQSVDGGLTVNKYYISHKLFKG